MLKTEYSLFLGKTDERVFSGFVTENNLFLVVESEGSSNEIGTAFLNLVKQRMRSHGISDLASFEALITESVRASNLPLGVSIAASYVHNNVVYLLTLGEGRIYLRRNKDFVNIIQGNSNASGPATPDDLFVLATQSFISLFSSEDQLKKVTLKNDVFTVVDAIYEEINDKEDYGITALFFSPLEVAETEVIVSDNEVTVEEGEKTALFSAKQRSHLRVPFRLPEGNPKRVLTGAVVVILFR